MASDIVYQAVLLFCVGCGAVLAWRELKFLAGKTKRPEQTLLRAQFDMLPPFVYSLFMPLLSVLLIGFGSGSLLHRYAPYATLDRIDRMGPVLPGLGLLGAGLIAALIFSWQVVHGLRLLMARDNNDVVLSRPLRMRSAGWARYKRTAHLIQGITRMPAALAVMMAGCIQAALSWSKLNGEPAPHWAGTLNIYVTDPWPVTIGFLVVGFIGMGIALNALLQAWCTGRVRGRHNTLYKRRCAPTAFWSRVTLYCAMILGSAFFVLMGASSFWMIETGQ